MRQGGRNRIWGESNLEGRNHQGISASSKHPEACEKSVNSWGTKRGKPTHFSGGRPMTSWGRHQGESTRFGYRGGNGNPHQEKDSQRINVGKGSTGAGREWRTNLPPNSSRTRTKMKKQEKEEKANGKGAT